MGHRRIYLASSWRNPFYPDALAQLRAAGHQVYDFRNPAPGNAGFSWASMDPAWQQWTPEAYAAQIGGAIPAGGYACDKDALDWADACVLLLPCGRSAHLEAGYMIGRGKPTFIVLNKQGFEPELMYLLASGIFTKLEEALQALADLPTVYTGSAQVRTPENMVTMGVGDGSGQAFVHGDWESINALRERLTGLVGADKFETRVALQRAREWLVTHPGRDVKHPSSQLFEQLLNQVDDALGTPANRRAYPAG